MASKRSGLGRGLSALFGDKVSRVPANSTDMVREIPVSEINPNPYQPRQNFDPQALSELAESIKIYGVLQPIIVRRVQNGSYELIAGERRLRAAKLINLEKIPTIIREYTDIQSSEIALIENLQRQNLNVIEEAQAYQRLIKDFGYTQAKIAEKIGVSRSQIANTVRLLNLAEPVKALVAKGILSPGQTKPLLALESHELQIKAAEMILSENLNTKTVEAFMREFKKTVQLDDSEVQKILSEDESVEEKNSSPEIVEENFSVPEVFDEKNSVSEVIEIEVPHENYVKLAENKLAEILNTQVKIVSDSQTNQIQITFSDDTQLLRIIRNFDRHITASKDIEVAEKNSPETKEDKIAALRKFSTSGTL